MSILKKLALGGLAIAAVAKAAKTPTGKRAVKKAKTTARKATATAKTTAKKAGRKARRKTKAAARRVKRAA